VLIYVQHDTWTFYEVWRKTPAVFSSSAPHGLQEGTLRMFQDLKQRTPAPWLDHFDDVSEILQSLNKEFVNQLYLQFKEREKQAADLTDYFLGKISEVAPEVREKIAEGLNPALIVERDGMRARLEELEATLQATRGEGEEKALQLQLEKDEVQVRYESLSQQLRQTGLLLAQAAIKDASWLEMVRRTMMPRQLGRVPFHHSEEVALRGYKAAAGGRKVPKLREVTWSRLPERESKLNRGYTAGRIFRGEDFVPGITITHRRRGETGPPAGNSDYIWQLPNTYYGDYLEVASSDNEPEAFVGWRDHEFQVKNPEGEKSEWVLFSYPFDDSMLESVRIESLTQGKQLLSSGDPQKAVEPLRKAWVFADRIYGQGDPRAIESKSIWEQARRDAQLAGLRFRAGDRLHVHDGPHVGKSGVVEQILFGHHHAYLIQPAEGEVFQASDAQVESALKNGASK
jgi:hypothetical protein